ncbi:MAG: GNAT family N-acetyltransferase [Terriglobia bacterium]
MAVAPQLPTLEILDLRRVRARRLASLFQEEQQHWREQLYWDYRPSVEIIRKHVDARNLPGCVAMSQGRVAGYCFFITEEDKATIGDLYVREEFRRERVSGEAGIATVLLEHTLETLTHIPGLRRIEGQLVSFDTDPLATLFHAHGFRSFLRLFMHKPLARAQPSRPGVTEQMPLQIPADLESAAELRVWDDGYFEAMAALVVEAYRGHADSQINDYYHNQAGALRFLKNIVIFPGCGTFQPDCSVVAVERGSPTRRRRRERLVGAILTSQVAPGVGHITQICVRPDRQRQGLGSRLLNAALARLAAKGYTRVSLTVTAENQAAVRLYRRLGFEVLKEFCAFARTLR